MPRLANIERMKVITRYNEISGLRLRNPFKKVSETIKVERINISERAVKNKYDLLLFYCFNSKKSL
jgi:hypothetical protein